MTFKLLKYLSFIIMLFVHYESKAGDIYYAQIISIDDNNVLKIAHNNLLRYVSFGYITTPISGEDFHTELSDYLEKRLVGQWARITELSYGDTSLVKPVLIRASDLTLINIDLISKGLAIPNRLTNPPDTLISASNVAQANKIGLWEDIQSFKDQRNSQKDPRLELLFAEYFKSAELAKEKGIEPYVGDKKIMKAYKLKCLPKINRPQFFATKYVAERKGYSLINDKCPD